MENKVLPKTTFSEVYEQMAKDLPIISKLKQMDLKFVDKSQINICEKYLDLLSEVFILFDINSNDVSSVEESVIICDKMRSLCHEFELKRTNQSIDNLLKDLESSVHTLEDKFNDCVREMKSQTSFEALMSDKIKFYSTKFKEYYNCVKTKENSLSKIGFTSDLREESIQQIRDNNQILGNRLNDINARLNEYKEFSPTESGLKNRINDLKAELSELDHIFNKL